MEPLDQRKIIIDVDHLTKDYGFHRGVFDVSIQVHEGECFGYLGPNGAGKSTTIRHIMGFSKPQKGSAKIFGIPTFGNIEKVLGRVGYLPGEPSLPSGLNGWGFLDMMGEMRGGVNKERRDYLLNLFKLDPTPNVKELSLGEKRKLAVVAAFMNDPEVLILDEPTSGLDPVMQQVFIKFVMEEKKRGRTILLSSHIFSEVEAVCDRISIIKDGVHVSTFNAKEVKAVDTVVYVIRFASKEGYEKYRASCPFSIVKENAQRLTLMIKFDKKDYKAFLASMQGVPVSAFTEKPFTLEDYFMSFYKEDKVFGGLSGVVGNSK